MNAAEKVGSEIELLDMDVTQHMLSFYAPFLNAIGAVKSSDLLSLRSDSVVLVAGVKVALQTPPIRSGRRVIFLTLDDGYGCSDSTFFPDTQVDYATTLYSTSLLLVRGHTRRTGERGACRERGGGWCAARRASKKRDPAGPGRSSVLPDTLWKVKRLLRSTSWEAAVDSLTQPTRGPSDCPPSPPLSQTVL